MSAATDHRPTRRLAVRADREVRAVRLDEQTLRVPHRLGFFHRVRSCFFDWDALEQRVGVRAERLGNQLGRRGLGDAKRAFPILGVRVHLDRLLGLVRLDERHLRLAELALVLQKQSALQIHLLDLRSLVPAVLRQRERVLEVAAGAGVLDAGVQKPELREQRRALLGPVQRPRPRVRHLLRGGSAPPPRARRAPPPPTRRRRGTSSRRGASRRSPRTDARLFRGCPPRRAPAPASTAPPSGLRRRASARSGGAGDRTNGASRTSRSRGRACPPPRTRSRRPRTRP